MWMCVRMCCILQWGPSLWCVLFKLFSIQNLRIYCQFLFMKSLCMGVLLLYTFLCKERICFILDCSRKCTLRCDFATYLRHFDCPPVAFTETNCHGTNSICCLFSCMERVHLFQNLKAHISCFRKLLSQICIFLNIFFPPCIHYWP